MRTTETLCSDGISGGSLLLHIQHSWLLVHYFIQHITVLVHYFIQHLTVLVTQVSTLPAWWLTTELWSPPQQRVQTALFTTLPLPLSSTFTSLMAAAGGRSAARSPAFPGWFIEI